MKVTLFRLFDKHGGDNVEDCAQQRQKQMHEWDARSSDAWRPALAGGWLWSQILQQEQVENFRAIRIRLVRQRIRQIYNFPSAREQHSVLRSSS